MEGDRLEALYVVALTTGMRLGELLALRWSNIDFKAAALSVRGTLHSAKGVSVIAEPKTSGSRRQISLGGLAVEALAAIG